MDCRVISELLAAYLDGEVTPKERKQIQAHLSACARCRKELEVLAMAQKGLRQALKEMAAKATPPAESWDRIKQRAGIKNRVEKPAPKRWSPALITVPLSVFLLVILVAGLFAGLGGSAMPPPEPPSLVSDGSGGAFVFWLDEPSKYGDGVYAQHIDAGGNLLWGEKGWLLTGEHDIYSGVPLAVSDGAGGAIVAWGDGNGIYAQRLDSQGNTVWGGEKVLVWSKPAGGWHGLIAMIADGEGGAVLLRQDNNEHVYAQRVSADGTLLWEEGGIYIGRIQYAYMGMPIVSDGSGGAVFIWEDSSGEDMRIYAQRINLDGELVWAEGGVSVTTIISEKERPQLINDGMGGFIVTWTDIATRTGKSRIYAQRLDAEGQPMWGEQGIHIGDNSSWQSDPQITADGAGSCVIAWREMGLWSTGGVFAQRLSPEGEPLWGDGVSLYTVEAGLVDSDIGDIYITGDGSGDSIVIWKGSGDATGVYAQKLGPDGQRLWSEGGVEVYKNPPFRTVGYSSVISDGNGGFIIVSRVSEGSDMSRTDSVYIQRIDSASSRLWGESGVEIQMEHSSPLLPIIAAVVILVTILVIYGVFRGSRVARVFTAIAPVLIGIAALFGNLLLIGPFGYSYRWAYILDKPADFLSVAFIPIAALAIGAVGIWKRTVTRWVTIPVVVFCALIAFIVESIIIASFF